MLVVDVCFPFFPCKVSPAWNPAFVFVPSEIPFNRKVFFFLRANVQLSVQFLLDACPSSPPGPGYSSAWPTPGRPALRCCRLFPLRPMRLTGGLLFFCPCAIFFSIWGLFFSLSFFSFFQVLFQLSYCQLHITLSVKGVFPQHEFIFFPMPPPPCPPHAFTGERGCIRVIFLCSSAGLLGGVGILAALFIKFVSVS